MTDGSGNIRDNAREALRLLGEAGWQIKAGKLVNAKGEAFRFEILYVQAGLERVILPFVKNLERLGITANARLVDAAQYQNRLDAFDYDMATTVIEPSLSPGNELRDLWGSKAAETEGSANLSGVRDPVVDELNERVIGATDHRSLVAATRALDRVLLWGFYMIPQYYVSTFLVAHWDKFGRPAHSPPYNVGFEAWWVDAAKAASLDARKAALKN